jgi:hypothetical protein
MRTGPGRGPATEAHGSKMFRGFLLCSGPAQHSTAQLTGQSARGEGSSVNSSRAGKLRVFPRRTARACTSAANPACAGSAGRARTANSGGVHGTLLRAPSRAARHASSFWVVVSVWPGSGATRQRVDTRVAPSPIVLSNRSSLGKGTPLVGILPRLLKPAMPRRSGKMRRCRGRATGLRQRGGGGALAGASGARALRRGGGGGRVRRRGGPAPASHWGGGRRAVLGGRARFTRPCQRGEHDARLGRSKGGRAGEEGPDACCCDLRVEASVFFYILFYLQSFFV